MATFLPAGISMLKCLNTITSGRAGYANYTSLNVIVPFIPGTISPSVELASIAGLQLMILKILAAAGPALLTSGKRT